jgi:hypothetical protein
MNNIFSYWQKIFIKSLRRVLIVVNKLHNGIWSSHSSAAEDTGLLGCYTISSSTYWHFDGLLGLYFMGLGSSGALIRLPNFADEGTVFWSFETSVTIYHSAWYNNPEDLNLYVLC